MIEVHELDILPASYQEESSSSSHTSSKSTNSFQPENENKNKNNLWTLTQFWRKERVDFHSMKTSRSKFSILATVDAISPIVAMDPPNPFALIEAYDKDNTDITCVIVLHGNQAMLNHPAIHPLDTLVFCDVVYQPWSVPKLLKEDKKLKDSSASTVFGHLKGRIPSHVFVATRNASVSWNRARLDILQPLKSPATNFSQDRIPATITPVNLVNMVQGKVYNVDTTSVRAGPRTASVIYYVDMILLDEATRFSNDEYVDDDLNRELPDAVSEVNSTETTVRSPRPRCRLYLSHFPMSMALQSSIRIGAILQARNIHLVCFQPKSRAEFDVNMDIRASYGACLRSTLVLLKHAIDIVFPSSRTGKESGNRLTRTHESTASVLKDVDIVGIQPLSTQPGGQSSASMESQSSVFHPQTYGFHGREKSYSKNQRGGRNECHPIDPQLPFLNHGFRRINENYKRTIFYELVEAWERRSFQGSLATPSKNCRSKELVPIIWIVNVLLLFNLQNDIEKNSKRINRHWSRNENDAGCIPLKTRRKLSIRSPYAEFFDHPFSFHTPQQGGDGITQQNVPCGCHLSIEDRKHSPSGPLVLLDLNGIRIASQRYFELHISRLLSPPSKSQSEGPLQQLRKGFHGSIRVPRRELYSNSYTSNTGNNYIHNDEYFLGGLVCELHTHTSSGVASIADGICQIPISFDEQNSKHAGINDFIIGQFDSVMISCLCLGNLSRGLTEKEKESFSISGYRSSVSKSLSFPALNPRNKHLWGNCALVTIHGLLFVTAIQIHCREYQVLEMTDSSSTEENKGGSKDVTLTVEDCLATHKFLSESFKSATLMGMVTRCRFHCKMNPDGSYKCCQLMISSLKRDNSKDLESDNSCLQALEMTLSVVPNTARMIKFNEMLDIVWPGVNLMETQKVLGSSFWVLGDSGRTCVLTFGGSEDIIPGSSCSKSSIKINFPNSSLQFTKLGYVRSFCTQDRVDAVFVHHSCDSEGQTKEILNKNMISRRFDFVGGLKVMNGMLNRRPSRRNMARSDYPFFRLVQELITAPSDAIPLNTFRSI